MFCLEVIFEISFPCFFLQRPLRQTINSKEYYSKGKVLFCVNGTNTTKLLLFGSSWGEKPSVVDLWTFSNINSPWNSNLKSTATPSPFQIKTLLRWKLTVFFSSDLKWHVCFGFHNYYFLRINPLFNIIAFLFRIQTNHPLSEFQAKQKLKKQPSYDSALKSTSDGGRNSLQR